ncbi:iron-sulfur cluster biosynthesis family protein [Carnobacterium jeotgali]|uniref:iron-sulfur cluster biosynthesis family protein n=1 Tax=Carnobacterium jeotgali TaxID=545534 RepID=UPI00388FB258
MFLTVTEPAIERLKAIQAQHPGKLALYYNRITGGYACGIVGTFSLKLVTSPNEELDATIDSTIGEIPVQSNRLEDLSENVVLDYKKTKNSLILKSDAGLINDDVTVLDNDNNKLF